MASTEETTGVCEATVEAEGSDVDPEVTGISPVYEMLIEIEISVVDMGWLVGQKKNHTPLCDILSYQHYSQKAKIHSIPLGFFKNMSARFVLSFFF